MDLKEKILKSPSPAKVLIECKKFYDIDEDFREKVDINYSNFLDKNPLEYELVLEMAEQSFFITIGDFYLKGSNLKPNNQNLINLFTAFKIYKTFNSKEN